MGTLDMNIAKGADRGRETPKSEQPAKPESAEDLREKIQALEMQKAAALGNIQEYEAKMQEIIKGPKDPHLQELNLQILNQYQVEKKRQETRYKDLAMEIARKKVQLEDLAN